MTQQALIGLGSNLGDRRSILDSALAALGHTPGVLVEAVSTYHETAPVGGPPGQGPFLNAAAALSTTLDPFTLARVLHEVEQAAGRVRSVRWGERVLDLDLLLFGEQVIDTPDLVVPHLGMALRHFVLAPLAEIAPDAVDPLTKSSVAQLLTNLRRTPRYVALAASPWSTPDGAGWPDSGLRQVFARTVNALSAVALCLTEVGRDSDLPVGLPESAVVWTGASVPPDLERIAKALRRARWAEEARRDAWLVSDFWFDQLLESARDVRDESRSQQIDGYALEVRPLLLQPTFVVFVGDLARGSLSEWVRRSHAHYPIGCDCPVLRVRSPEVERWQTAMREAETDRVDTVRLGTDLSNVGVGDLSRSPRWEAASDGWVEAVATEIVAACHATEA